MKYFLPFYYFITTITTISMKNAFHQNKWTLNLNKLNSSPFMISKEGLEFKLLNTCLKHSPCKGSHFEIHTFILAIVIVISECPKLPILKKKKRKEKERNTSWLFLVRVMAVMLYLF